jgi:hypothetical protein
MQAVIQQVIKRVRAKGKGYVFTPKDFLDLGNRAAVDQALSRLARDEKIRRIRRGLYDLPQVSPRLGILSPVPHKVAQAMARRSGSQLLPSGAQAANALGLSTQVAAKPVYITDGPSQTITIGRQTIQLRQVPARYFLGSRGADLAIHVLRYLGQSVVSTADVQKLRTTLSRRDKRTLCKSIHSMPSWMGPHIKQIAQPA